MGLYMDNGEENGNHRDYIWVIMRVEMSGSAERGSGVERIEEERTR